MGKQRPTRVESVELRFGCTKCLASPGGWCWGKGVANPYLHRERFDAATRAGALPLAD